MNWLRKFMMGRYGMDQMGIALTICMMASTLIGSLTGFFPLYVLEFALMGWTIFRILSRNTGARMKENQKFMVFWNAVQKWGRLQKQRFHDRKTHRYYRCPNCKKQLRVPKGHGKIEITCPYCRAKFVKKT